MMIFNSFTVANDYNFARDDRTAAVVAFSLATNKTFEGVCLALAGKFLQNKL